MEKSPLLSVIVAAYNTSNYIQKCLDSIIKQSYTNIEVVLVDDGSTDNTPQICDLYSAQDSRVKVIHQENYGVIYSRFTGANVCSGDYIMFVDSDDWIDLDICAKLLHKAEAANAEVVICDFMTICNNTKKVTKCQPPSSTKELLHAILQSRFPHTLCSRIYKRDIVLKALERCSGGGNISEDLLISVSCILYNPTIAYVPEALYYYNRDVESSLVLKLSSLGKSFYYGKDNIDMVHSLLVDEGLYEEYKYDFYHIIFEIKIYLLNEGRIKEARSIYPEAHKEIIVFYPISNPLRWFYYVALNWGTLGWWYFCFFKSLKKHFYCKRLDGTPTA